MSRSIVIANRYNVLTDQALPNLNSGNYDAFVVTDSQDKDNSLFALKVSNLSLARYDYLPILSKNQINHLTNLVDWRVASWSGQPDSKDKNLILIFQNPVGKKIMGSLSERIEPWPEAKIIKDLIIPMHSVLSELKKLGLTHRAIRPDNLYITQESQMIAGECVSVAPGYRQATLFEPVNSAMALPYARGNSTIASDLYALGVTALILHLGYNPCEAMSEEDILFHKLEVGSYGALIGNIKIKGRLIELFKNLLVDNIEDRWDLDTLENWARASAIVSRPTSTFKRAGRALDWSESRKIFDVRTLSYILRESSTLSLKKLSEPDISIWIKNSFSDKAMAEFFINTYETMSGKKKNNIQISGRSVLMRTCYTLYPHAPLLWTDKSLMIDGLSHAVVVAELSNDKTELYQKLLMDPAFESYINGYQKTIPEVDGFASYFATLRRHLINPKVGYGMERCIYTLNPNIFCLSPMIIDQCAFTPQAVVEALDKVAPKVSSSKFPIDRHILAFLATHTRKQVQDREINDMNSADAAQRLMTALHIFSSLQNDYSLGALPNLAQWFLELTGPQLKKIKNRKTLEQLKTTLTNLIEKGNLTEIYLLLNNKDIFINDEIQFEKARREYYISESQVKKIEKKVFKNSTYLRQLGGRTAVSVSSVAGVVYTGLFSLYHLLKGG